MNKTICFLLILLSWSSFAQQGCIIGNKPQRPQYVCFDGRSLSQTCSGLLWQAKRGCFMSKRPCCAYQATHYSYSPNPGKVYASFKRCRATYPFHLGEMQTH